MSLLIEDVPLGRFKSRSRRIAAGIEITYAFCRDFAFPPHVHEGLIIGVVTTGQEKLCYRGEKIASGKGVVYVSSPDVVHGGESVDHSIWSYCTLSITPDAAIWDFNACLKAQIFGRGGVLGDNPATKKVGALLEDIILNCEQLSAEIAICEIYSILSKMSLTERSYAPRKKENKRLKSVRNYIDSHYRDDLSLLDLAHIAKCSPQYLIAIFDRYFGATPYAYLIARRISVARRKLIQGEALSSIATHCGFYDQSHLNRHFVRIFGQSPAAYAKSVAA